MCPAPQQASPHVASQHFRSSRYMFIFLATSTAICVSRRPRPRQMALATMPKRCRNLMAERESDQAAARLVCRGPDEEGEGICILE